MKLRADVSVTDTDTGLVLLDERAGKYFQMNSTGAFVLHRLLEGVPEPDVVSLLRKRYAVGAERAAADVAALVDRLRSAGLVSGGWR
ncbi:lasso peptide biosynthesis PqqD family chaperone [Amycolatopsis rhizosphaerae]|uniref:Lasso peptide biosynthesis PqqD family chaperone n=1 Tax=Amycolatopsis rhizosphaerae TaxID=2053003 RepID=A0A558BGI4_9PSEU|nr:lasso peptide biosynthesis PqqD family chaperone [Amycolatopsis rhizosphaerae]TVT35612.1 lasso peptide biosynthesis PqqD family chaperone [Amycolatopsis rhizosphaerae]